MKKWMSLLLAALMVTLCAASSLAETLTIAESSPFFNLTFDAPDGATVDQEIFDGTTVVDIKLIDQPGLNFMFTIAFDDLYTGRSMADLTDDELSTLFAQVMGEVTPEEAEYAMTTMDDGIKVMMVFAKETPEVAIALTIMNGYFLQAFAMYDDYAQYVTQQDLASAVWLLDLVNVTPVETTK